MTSPSAVDVFATNLEVTHRRLRDNVVGLTPEQMTWRAKPGTNSIAFYVWHSTRFTDLFINRRLRGRPELWFEDNWSARIPIEAEGQGRSGLGVGMGYSDEQVGAMPALPGEEYLAYVDAVLLGMAEWLKTLAPASLLDVTDFEIMPNWRTIDVLTHTLNHIHLHRGEIWYLKGLIGIPNPA